MNFEIEPEEYVDPDSLISVILEALRLLVSGEDEREKHAPVASLPPPIRLKDGYGPEVIWTLNIFADRALELILEDDVQDTSSAVKVTYVNRTSSAPSHTKNKTNPQSLKENSMIIIGQPHVGGGLTTRPLGNYQVDDESLQLGDDTSTQAIERVSVKKTRQMSQAERQNRVDRARDSLGMAMSALEDTYDHRSIAQWLSYAQTFDKFRKGLEEFHLKSSSTLSVVAKRVERQLDVIKKRENFIHSNLKGQLSEFLKVWNDYASETARNKLLTEQVIQRTDRFGVHVETLELLKSKMELRIRDLSSGGKLRELESASERLKRDSQELDVKVGLLLAIESKDKLEKGRVGLCENSRK